MRSNEISNLFERFCFYYSIYANKSGGLFLNANNSPYGNLDALEIIKSRKRTYI